MAMTVVVTATEAQLHRKLRLMDVFMSFISIQLLIQCRLLNIFGFLV